MTPDKAVIMKVSVPGKKPNIILMGGLKMTFVFVILLIFRTS